MYRVPRSSPPNVHAVVFCTGTSTTSSSVPSGVYRWICPWLITATQIPPSASTVSPSGLPSPSSTSTSTRRFVRPSSRE